MKKYFEYIGLLSLVCFSFFLTDKTVTVVQEVDDIMVQIKAHQEEYQKEGENAVIKEKYIIPGLPSKKVNIDKSYQEMKKLGIYDSSYFVYDIEKPEENLDKNLDKYIISGNSSKRIVSLIFIINENSISSILDKIGTNQVSFIIPSYQFQKEIKNIEKAISLGNEFLIMDSNEQNYLSFKQKLETLKNPCRICYNELEDENFLSLCSKNRYYTITSTKITKNPLMQTKEKLSSGSFLVFEVNKQLLEELPSIISYIESRGYSIEVLSTHLKED